MADENNQPGLRRIAAITAGAKQKAEATTSTRRAVRWPSKGDAHDGVKPGEWRFGAAELDDTMQLPADCPVRPLGYDGEQRFFVDTAGQIFNTDGKAMGVERMQILFSGHENFLYWAWPSFAKGSAVTGFKAEDARRDLYAACYDRGPWNMTDQVRGRGAWLDDRGRLILHCGEVLWFDGKQQDTGELGDHFYVRRVTSIVPWGNAVEKVEDNPAVEIVEALRTWNFVRGDVDVILTLGWIGVALMGAALDWRPSAFLIGDAGGGKSELHRLLKTILNRFMVSTTNATSAGLYQIVGHDAVPIAVDELEGEDGQAQAAEIIKMARDAASGSIRIRGGANHQGVEFQARSTFLFSAIVPPPLPPASLSRLAVLQLRPLEAPKEGEIRRAPKLTAPETVGPKLLRRVADHWEHFPHYYEAYMAQLQVTGHDSRGQNTFGTFLAAAHLLLGDEGMTAVGWPAENYYHFARLLAADAAPETAGKTPNWSKLIDEIFTSQVDAWNKGERRTIGQILDDLQNGERNNVTMGKANEILAIAGLAVLGKGRVGEGYGLAVPHEGKDINKLIADSTWAAAKGSNGSWKWALKQAPDYIVKDKILMKSARNGDVEKMDNRVSIGGTQRRCSFISLADLKTWQEE